MAARGVGEQSRASALAFAAGWLSRPACVVAVVVLLLNDHVLKAAYGAWWTGKLSDVAGLVFAPALVAVAVGAVATHLSPERVRQVSVGLVALVFTLVKVTVWGADAASAAWTVAAGPSVILRDATDLVALPALALSWWCALEPGQGGGRLPASPTPAERGARRSWRDAVGTGLRWGVVLPLAVLATAATSPRPDVDVVRKVAVVDGSVVAVRDTVDGDRPLVWFISADGDAWRPLALDDEGLPPVRYLGDAAESACVPRHEGTCFAIVPDRLAVQRSDDGGDTWEIDWEVPDGARAALAARAPGDAEDLVTQSVAILSTEDGYRVYAANGADGMAVRDEVGTWRRRGFVDVGGDPTLTPLPTERAIPGVLPAGWPVGVGAGSVALLALAALQGRTPVRWPTSRARRVTRVVVVTVNLAGSALLLRTAARLTTPRGGYEEPNPVEVLGGRGAVAFLLLSVVVLTAVAVVVAGLDARAAIGPAILVGAIAGLMFAVVPGVAGFVAAGAVTAGSVAFLVRRSRARSRTGVLV